jgi:hypothetical protein
MKFKFIRPNGSVAPSVPPDPPWLRAARAGDVRATFRSAPRISAALHTSIHAYSQSPGGPVTGYAPVSGASVPVSIGADVTTVTGLDNCWEDNGAQENARGTGYRQAPPGTFEDGSTGDRSILFAQPAYQRGVDGLGGSSEALGFRLALSRYGTPHLPGLPSSRRRPRRRQFQTGTRPPA